MENVEDLCPELDFLVPLKVHMKTGKSLDQLIGYHANVEVEP